MDNIKTINTTSYDVSLKQFIDRLSKIELPFSLTKKEKLIISETGLTSILFTLCFVKAIMSATDEEIINSIGFSKSFYGKLKPVIKKEVELTIELGEKYFQYLKEINPRFSKNRVNELIFKYFEKGQQYLRENYLPLYSLDQNINEEQSLQKLEKEIKISKNKVKKLLKMNKKLILESTDNSITNSLFDLNDEITNEYNKIIKMTEFIINKNFIYESFLFDSLAFMENKGLIPEFYDFTNKSNEEVSNIIKMEDRKKKKD